MTSFTDEGDFALRFATVDCLTFAIGAAGFFFGPGGQIGSMLINQVIYSAADDQRWSIRRVRLEHNKMWESAGGGTIPEAVATADAVRVGGNRLAWGVSGYQCGRSAGVR